MGRFSQGGMLILNFTLEQCLSNGLHYFEEVPFCCLLNKNKNMWFLLLFNASLTFVLRFSCMRLSF